MRRNLGSCPYYRHFGLCTFGCYSEPECITCEPEGGWPPVRTTERGYAFVRKIYLRQAWGMRIES